MIKSTYYLKLSLLLILGIISSKLFASHMFGADMSYTYLGNSKYKIIVRAYRDCRGISMSTIDFKAFAGTNGGNGCGTVTPGTLTRTSIRDVTPKCSTSSTPCSPTNTYGTGQGIEEHIFESIIDFNSSPLNTFVNKSSCCEVTFYINQCCRNGAITTGPAGNDFYTTCMINICNLKKTKIKSNNSPIFSTEPTGFLCCNVPWYFNNGAIDTVDFDSISYKLVRGLNAIPNNSVTYTTPYTQDYPMTPFCIPPTTIKCKPIPTANPPRGFFFDSTNGNIIATPTKCNEAAVLVIEQTEWRQDTSTNAWIIVGKSRRDMQIWILNDCGYNRTPTINGNFNTAVCEGDKICHKIIIKDSTFTPYQVIPDTIIGNWNNGIPSATFKVLNSKSREKEYEFCWQTKIGDARTHAYMFTVTATDQHCTPPVISSRAFKVKVNPIPVAKIKSRQLTCKLFEFSTIGNISVDTSEWYILDYYSNKTIQYLKRNKDTVSLNPGKYIINLKVKNRLCANQISDTINVTYSVKNDTVIINACNDYFDKNRKITYTKNTTYTDTLKSADGQCDSIYRDYYIRITKLNDSIYYQFPYLYAKDTSAQSYEWLDCNNAYKSVKPSTLDSMKYWPKTGGSYALKITKNGCIDTSFCIQISSNLVDKENIFASSIFPNPVKNDLRILANQPMLAYEVIDIHGKLIFRENVNTKLIILNFNHFNRGQYFIKIFNIHQQVLIHKVIKE